MSRPLVVGLALAVIAAGIGLALLLGGGDDGKKHARSASPAQTQSAPTQTVTTETETTRTSPARPPKQDAKGIEQAVTTFIEASEESDSARACGQVLGGAGKQLPSCAEAVGIDLRTLPSSDELDIAGESASGSKGQANLSNGSTFSLKKSGGKWLISGYHARPGGLNSQ